MKRKILTVLGTRPEAIKLAPVLREINTNVSFESHICVTAQHREMLDQVLSLFQIVPDYDLDIMRPRQSLSEVTNRALSGVSQVIEEIMPDIVIVQGDTTTTFAASLASYYLDVSVGHVEAGLRTGDLFAPFPEECNRVMTSILATWHFAPTLHNRQNLLREGIADERITVTGNTVIDSLLWVKEIISKQNKDQWNEYWGRAKEAIRHGQNPIILITGHRRENFGDKFRSICDGLRELARRHPEWNFIYPVHLNPNVREPVNHYLGELENFYLLEPLEYVPFIYLMDRSHLILTDSGGVQEEAPALGKPVLVLREKTERHEVIESGATRLIGTSAQRIVLEVEVLMNDKSNYSKMARATNPYGDGRASQRIVDVLKKRFY